MIFLRQSLYSAGLFATVLLCWLPSMAQTSSAQAAKPDTISGRVVNESGRPLPDARVTLRRLGSMGPESTNTTTDGEGKFEPRGLQPVNYQVFAYLQGYIQLFPALDETQAGVYRPGNSATLVLKKGGVITGRVTNQAGEPVVGEKLYVYLVPAERETADDPLRFTTVPTLNRLSVCC
jgi:protocatechuate 3,4-dioxygenase beta subunit